jgi:hypothetical protein
MKKYKREDEIEEETKDTEIYNIKNGKAIEIAKNEEHSEVNRIRAKNKVKCTLSYQDDQIEVNFVGAERKIQKAKKAIKKFIER